MTRRERPRIYVLALMTALLRERAEQSEWMAALTEHTIARAEIRALEVRA